jgi:hypothetical protein
MPVRLSWVAALASVLVSTAACNRSSDASAVPAITLTAAGNGAPAYVALTGLPASAVRALEQADLTQEQWASVLRVAVSNEAPPILGDYVVRDGVVRFTPLFPFDQGRQYRVRFEPAQIPGGGMDAGGVTEATIGIPPSTAVPSTAVARVYPSGDVVPENLLRMYIEFSAPMGRKSGVEYIALLDHQGQEIPGAVLPLDYEFWSPDHKRFTVFFDPGRVKKGILPNLQMGRPLEVGRSVTLVIKREWPDENGLPLKEFRRVLRVGPTDLDPLDTAAWRIHPPAAGSREGVVVVFPEPLDHGLLMRALGVTRDGKEVEGTIGIDQGETRWTLTPMTPWRAGAYQLLALDILEDVAGNQIGRAFEVDNFDTVDKGPNPQTIAIPFRVH